MSMRMLVVLALVGATTACVRLEQKNLTSGEVVSLEEQHRVAFDKMIHETCLDGQVYTNARLSSLVAIAGQADEEHWTSMSMCLSYHDGASLIQVTCEDTACVAEDVQAEPVSGEEEIITYDSDESI